MALNNILTKQSLANKLSVSERTLDRWHSVGIGPARIKNAGFVGYKIESVEKWLDECEINNNNNNKKGMKNA